jgi:ClpP class serine protease
MTSSTHLPHIAARLIGVPLMVDAARARVIADALASRIGLAPPAPTPAAMVDDADGSGSYAIEDGVAIIRVGGSLIRRGGWIEAASGVVSYETIAADVDRALADPGVAAILMDLDSAGGEVAGVFDLADKIHAARGRKPMWAASNEMALSAAYAIASACDVIAVTRTAYAGSIGVLAMHTDWSCPGLVDTL